MSSLVEMIEARFRDPFQHLAALVSSDYPNVRAGFFSWASGSLTVYQGHAVGIDCLLTDVLEGPDNISLVIDLAFLTTVPKLYASVCWGHPSGHVEAETFSDWTSSTEWPDVSDDLLEQLYADVPRLQEAFVTAVRRRKPSE